MMPARKPVRIKIARILCPVDYSEFSERALARAVKLARWFEATLTVVHVIPTPLWVGSTDPGVPYAVPGDLLRALRREEEEGLKQCLEPARKEGLVIDARLQDGDPSRVIQDIALELPADLVVMGTHGRGGFEHLLLGSVAEKVLRRATCPVLTVGSAVASTHDSPLFRRILCAMDLTEASGQALEMAMSLAEENMAELTLLHVLEGLPGQAGPARYRELPQVVRIRKELFEEATERLRRSVSPEARDFCTVNERVEEGAPWREVLRVAEETRAEIVVMGAHSRGALSRAFFGSTVNQVVRSATCPVLVARQTPTPEPGAPIPLVAGQKS